jgi:hypothetical protein
MKNVNDLHFHLIRITLQPLLALQVLGIRMDIGVVIIAHYLITVFSQPGKRITGTWPTANMQQNPW